MAFSRPEAWSGSPSLLQGIFPTQGPNPGLLHCRWLFYQMNHQESLLIKKRETFPTSVLSPRQEEGCPAVLHDFFLHAFRLCHPSSFPFCEFAVFLVAVTDTFLLVGTQCGVRGALRPGVERARMGHGEALYGPLTSEVETVAWISFFCLRIT